MKLHIDETRAAHGAKGSRRWKILLVLLSVCILALGLRTADAAQKATKGPVQTIFDFSYTKSYGFYPLTGLVVGPGNGLFGTTYDSIYQLSVSTKGVWSEYSFLVVPEGSAVSIAANSNWIFAAFNYDPSGGPCVGSEFTCGFISQMEPAGADYSDPYLFQGGSDGDSPQAIIVDANKVVHGVTAAGGASPNCGATSTSVPYGCGTLFEIDPSETETLLHVFQGNADGGVPLAAPALDGAGNIYFTSYSGSPANCKAVPSTPGGTVGAILNGQYSVLMNFGCVPAGPVSTPFPVAVGNSAATALIVTTTGGGTNAKDCAFLKQQGCGAIYLLTKPAQGNTWTSTILHEFTGKDGLQPYGSLFAVSANTLYGVTAGGGKFASSCNAIYKKAYGCGVIYQLVNNGSGWEWGGVVYSFPGGAGGALPNGLLTAYKGQIFGTTEFGGTGSAGGCAHGCGTVFTVSP